MASYGFLYTKAFASDKDFEVGLRVCDIVVNKYVRRAIPLYVLHN